MPPSSLWDGSESVAAQASQEVLAQAVATFQVGQPPGRLPRVTDPASAFVLAR